MENCTALGLNGGNIVYVGYASSSAGANFSLGTPLSTSKYIAFISLPSTASNPTASSFTGLWTELYGAVQYVDDAAVSQTSGTTATVISSFTIPIDGWKVNDEITATYNFWTATPSASGKQVELFIGGQSLVVLDLSITSADNLTINLSVKKTSSTEVSFSYTAIFTDSIGLLLTDGLSTYFGQASGLINTDTTATTLNATATCANGAQTLNTKYSSAKLTRS